MSFSRIALLTTASLLCFSFAPSVLAANDKLTDMITNGGDKITTDTLNQAMLDLMNGRDEAQPPEQQAGVEPPCPAGQGQSDEAPNAVCLAGIAPAAGDDGGDEAEEETDSDAEGDDSLNDAEPPQDDPPEEEETPPEEETPDECGECGQGESDDEGGEQENAPA